jgi:iron complex outermembrane receptor protein
VNLAVGSAPTAGADSLLIGTERANNAELGFKSTLWDRRLQLNANLFWTQVNAYQTNAYDDVNRVQYLTNAGSVRSRGVEFESTVIPLRGLTLNFNGSYNDVSYLPYKDAPCPPEVSQAPGAPASATSAATRWSARRNGSATPTANTNGIWPTVCNLTSPAATRSAPKRWARSRI